MKVISVNSPMAAPFRGAWTASADFTLDNVYCQQDSAVVSFDPQLTWAAFSAPGNSDVIDEVRIPSNLYPENPLQIPVPAGSTLFVAFSGLNSAVCQLFLREVELT